MATGKDTAQLRTDFIGIAGRLERLLNPDLKQSTYDAEKLQRWQNLYADDARRIVGYRDLVLEQPASADSAKLEQWIKSARECVPDEGLFADRESDSAE